MLDHVTPANQFRLQNLLPTRTKYQTRMLTLILETLEKDHLVTSLHPKSRDANT